MTETATLYKFKPFTVSDLSLIALDPGLSGVIAILKNNTITAHPFPIAGKALDLAALTHIIRDAAPELAVIEKVHSMPGQGVVQIRSRLWGIARHHRSPQHSHRASYTSTLERDSLSRYS